MKPMKYTKFNKTGKPAYNNDRPQKSFGPKKDFSQKKDFGARKPSDKRRIFEKKIEENNAEPEQLYLKGRHEVVQALESGQNLDAVFVSSAVRGPVVSQIRELASSASIPVKEMSPELFERKFGEKTQGIAAVAGAFEYSSLEDLIERAEEGHSVLVALNQVEDARNLGAIVRTVECMGCDGVIIPKHRSAGMTEWAIRTAQGAAAWLPVARVNNLGDALEELKKAGYWVAGLDGSGKRQVKDLNFKDTKVVLVAGGEDVGLGERVKKACDDVVMIPMNGRTTSLNVSVSVAMALYEILRQKDFFAK